MSHLMWMCIYFRCYVLINLVCHNMFRPIPPSQAVMAVSNTYGRVRKPIGFNLIGLLSGIQGFDRGKGHSDLDSDCSLWMPVAPPGYTALGCVVNIGNQPPPNHVVYCIRSDLVTSTMSLECILSAPSNSCFTNGFSIWRLDNVVGSYFAHPSAECPTKEKSFDLNHLLVNPNRHHSAAEELASDLTDDHGYRSQTNEQSANSSGWDIVRSISKATNCYIAIPNFERIWWDKGSDIRRPVSIWRPIARPGYAILGDCITEG